MQKKRKFRILTAVVENICPTETDAKEYVPRYGGACFNGPEKPTVNLTSDKTQQEYRPSLCR